MSLRRCRERGLVLPSWLALASLGLVALAVLALFIADSPGPAPAPRPVADSASEPDQTKSTGAEPGADKPGKDKPGKDKPARNRQPPTPQAYVEVYNNSTVTGLAAQTSSELQDAGWDVVVTANWYGDVPATTVYYPERLRDQARLLARDLDVDRLRPAVSPMRFDRLTVILTATA